MSYWESPYLAEGRWLRGSLHTHTTVSDGSHPPAEAVDLYARVAQSPRHPAMNYHFLALTDHTTGTTQAAYAEPPSTEAFTVLMGREDSFGPHIVGVGCPMTFGEDIIGKPGDAYTLEDHQRVIDRIADEGGMAILAHPHWKRINYWSGEQAATLKRYTAIEILNGDLFTGPANLATDVWDDALTAGRRVWAVGSDDFHSTRDFHNAWTMVYARENSAQAILEALRQGSCYASNGAAFSRIYADGPWIVAEGDDDALYADCEKTFRFISEGGRLRQLQMGKNHVAAYKGMGDEQYIRVELALNWGFAAFGQPFFCRAL